MFEEIKNLLIETLLKENTKKRNRKILFWYDEKQEYGEFVSSLNIDNTEVIIYEDNSFWIRYHLEYEEKDKNIIIYFPLERIKGIKNPLLDLESLNSDYIFNPDSTTMRIKNLGLDEECRKVIKKYSKFFNNKKREDLFRDFEIEKNEDNIDYIVTAIILNIKSVSDDDILKNIMLAYYSEYKKIEELSKFGSQSFILDLFNNTFGTNANSFDDFDECFKSLIFTYFAYDIKDIEKIARYNKYILKTKTTNVYVFVNSLMRDILTKECFEKVALDIQNEFGIDGLLDKMDIDSYKYSDAFNIVDIKLSSYIVEQLISNSPEYSRYLELINIRESKYFYRKYENVYNMLKYSVIFIEKLSKVQDNIKVDEIEIFSKKYAEELCLIDTYYRKIYYYFDNIEDKDEYIVLKDKIENMYVNNFISNLSIKWSEMLEGMPSYNANRLVMQNTFYKRYVKPYYDKKDRVIVIISDAFRYECALELTEKIKSIGTKVDLDYMLGTVPSYTKLGMASLLPNKKIEMKKDSDDIIVDDMASSSIKDRDSILKNERQDSFAIKYEDLYSVTKKEWKKMFTGQKVVYIYHDTVDNSGEHNENKIFEACEEAINELEKLVKDLHLTFGGINAFITADHGFFYKRGKLENHEKVSKDNEATKQKTRYSYSENKNLDEGLLSIDLKYIFGENSGYVNVPKGNTIFARQGTGINYVHGGAMPQEIIVPVIDFKSSRTSEENKKVTITYSGLTTKITNAITYLEFLQDMNVDEKWEPCRYLLHFEDEAGNRISDECTIIANYENTEVKNRFFKEKFVFKNMEYNRDNIYYLVIIDEETGIVAEKIKFMIDITIINNFGF